jgi:translation elongation factor EF-Tu-like GTPase
MSQSPFTPDAREVDRIEALVTVNDPAKAELFLHQCLPGTTWRVQIRTADVSAIIRDRTPLGSLNERDCTCLSLKLARPVPVEPGLRFQIVAEDDESLNASGLVRPWRG